MGASRPSGELEPALARVLTATWGSAVTVLRCERLSTGASRETYAVDVEGGPVSGLILQRSRPGSPQPERMVTEARLLRAAAAAGVPVAPLVADAGTVTAPELGDGWLISHRLAGETIPRRLLRDDVYAEARRRLPAQLGDALARIHSIDPAVLEGTEVVDELARYRDIWDSFGEPSAALEIGFRWLELHRPEPTGLTVVHGDFRNGNLLVDPGGLVAVLDWELAHLGDPMEDLGWCCVRAWRFGAPGEVGGFGPLPELLDAYAEASGTRPDPRVVRWWQVLGTLKWAVMCRMQAEAHLSGLVRSVELATIGRRVVENERDLLELIAPGSVPRAPVPTGDPLIGGVHGRPTAAELLEAVRGFLEDEVRGATGGRVSFLARVAANAVAIVERELRDAGATAARHAARLAKLGFADEASLAAALRSGTLDDRLAEVATAIGPTVAERLAVANPRWFPGD